MREIKILELSLNKLSAEFDDFIGACLDSESQPVAPPINAVMRARGCLPAGRKHSFNKSSAAGKINNLKVYAGEFTDDEVMKL